VDSRADDTGSYLPCFSQLNLLRRLLIILRVLLVRPYDAHVVKLSEKRDKKFHWA
jgi:hypothetical protein